MLLSQARLLALQLPLPECQASLQAALAQGLTRAQVRARHASLKTPD